MEPALKRLVRSTWDIVLFLAPMAVLFALAIVVLVFWPGPIVGLACCLVIVWLAKGALGRYEKEHHY